MGDSKTLYKLTDEYLDLRPEIGEHDDLPADLETRFDEIKGAIDAKVRSIQRLILLLQDEMKARGERLDEFEAAQKADKRTIAWLTHYCTVQMQKAKIETVPDPDFGGFYELVCEKKLMLGSDIPEDLVEPGKPLPMRKEIREYLLADVPVGDCYLEDEWTVKRRKSRA